MAVCIMTSKISGLFYVTPILPQINPPSLLREYPTSTRKSTCALSPLKHLSLPFPLPQLSPLPLPLYTHTHTYMLYIYIYRERERHILFISIQYSEHTLEDQILFKLGDCHRISACRSIPSSFFFFFTVFIFFLFHT